MYWRYHRWPGQKDSCQKPWIPKCRGTPRAAFALVRGVSQPPVLASRRLGILYQNYMRARMHHAIPDLDLFRASLSRTLAVSDFFVRFYDRFMDDSPEIAAYFRNKDTAGIHRKLRTTLEMLAENARHQPGLELYLEMLGRTHRKFHVRPEHFALWREALLATVVECDPQLDRATRLAWEAVMDDLIAKLGIPMDGFGKPH